LRSQDEERETATDDIEGHVYKGWQDTQAADESDAATDDIEGHARRQSQDPEVSDEDDVEGHKLL